jgi:quaternary ammonium compound-resistance protein SugE
LARYLENTMAWIWLLLSGLVEIVWSVSLKFADGFTKLWPTVVVIISGLVSMALLSLALRGISMGTAYAVWAGIGAVGVAVTGMILFGESREALRLLSIAAIIAGIVGLKLTAS